jgi:hypothetical protein
MNKSDEDNPYTDNNNHDDECTNNTLRPCDIDKANTVQEPHQPPAQQEVSDSSILCSNLNDNCSQEILAHEPSSSIDSQTNGNPYCYRDSSSSSSSFKGDCAALPSTKKNKNKNHTSNNTHLFVGPFAHIRKSLDYNYHSNYCKERQWFQDSIIEDILGHVMTTRQISSQEGPINKDSRIGEISYHTDTCSAWLFTLAWIYSYRFRSYTANAIT